MNTGTDGGQQVAPVRNAQRQCLATANDRAAAVAEGASMQAHGLLDDTRPRLEEQAAKGVRRVAANLQRLGWECLALADGRPGEAPVVADLVRQAADGLVAAAGQAHRLSHDVESRSVMRLLEDLDVVARRHPGVVATVAAATGLAAGRVLRFTPAKVGGRAQQHHGGALADELAPTALDALSERLWPGDARPKPTAHRPARSTVDHDQRRSMVASRHRSDSSEDQRSFGKQSPELGVEVEQRLRKEVELISSKRNARRREPGRRMPVRRNGRGWIPTVLVCFAHGSWPR